MKLDKFTTAYLECALWSSIDNATEQGGEPLDANYTIDDIAPAALAEAIEACRQFQADHSADIAEWGEEQAGHDFWLTRNGHGAGFWDRYSTGPMQDMGVRLTDAAKIWGSVDLYVGDDGLIYQ